MSLGIGHSPMKVHDVMAFSSAGIVTHFHS